MQSKIIGMFFLITVFFSVFYSCKEAGKYLNRDIVPEQTDGSDSNSNNENKAPLDPSSPINDPENTDLYEKPIGEIKFIGNYSKERVCQRDDIIFCDDFDTYKVGVDSSAVVIQEVDRRWKHWDKKNKYNYVDNPNSSIRPPVRKDNATQIIPGGVTKAASTNMLQFKIAQNPYYRASGCTTNASINEGTDDANVFLTFCGGFLLSSRQEGVQDTPCYGYDRVFVRYYMKFEKGYKQGCWNHASSIQGCTAVDQWSCKDPPISEGLRFSSGVEGYSGEQYGSSRFPYTVGYPGATTFYTYWHSMVGQYGTQTYTATNPADLHYMEDDRWYSVEVMIKMNDPGVKNGEQALWIDGIKVIHSTDIDWRKATGESAKMGSNLFRLHRFIHYSPQENRVYHDNIVVSTNYIGVIENDLP